MRNVFTSVDNESGFKMSLFTEDNQNEEVNIDKIISAIQNERLQTDATQHSKALLMIDPIQSWEHFTTLGYIEYFIDKGYIANIDDIDFANFALEDRLETLCFIVEQLTMDYIHKENIFDLCNIANFATALLINTIVSVSAERITTRQSENKQCISCPLTKDCNNCLYFDELISEDIGKTFGFTKEKNMTDAVKPRIIFLSGMINTIMFLIYIKYDIKDFYYSANTPNMYVSDWLIQNSSKFSKIDKNQFFFEPGGTFSVNSNNISLDKNKPPLKLYKNLSFELDCVDKEVVRQVIDYAKYRKYI